MTNVSDESTPTPAESVTPAAQPAGQAPAAAKPGTGFSFGTGRRKRAVARVRVRPGGGDFVVNGRKPDVHFCEEKDRKAIFKPLEVTDTLGKMDVSVTVNGGGFTGQAGAIVLGLARALKRLDTAYEPSLRSANLLTRDSRMVERKKYGQSGARRRFQFSKR
ncbi:MAG: 30S ribosomal protein S9 [Phycisphaerae bacterium]|nr:30S ribosomal protein S9 [Phycisphaerae bacterium]